MHKRIQYTETATQSVYYYYYFRSFSIDNGFKVLSFVTYAVIIIIFANGLAH